MGKSTPVLGYGILPSPINKQFIIDSFLWSPCRGNNANVANMCTFTFINCINEKIDCFQCTKKNNEGILHIFCVISSLLILLLIVKTKHVFRNVALSAQSIHIHLGTHAIHYPIIPLSNYQIFTLLHYRIITLSNYHIIILSHYHIIPYHIITLSHNHIMTLSYYHVINRL